MLNVVVLYFVKGQGIKEFGLAFGGGGFIQLVTLMARKPTSRVRPAILFHFTIYFFLSLHIYFLLYLVYCCTQAFSSCGEQRLLFAAVLELLIVMFLMWQSTGSRHSGFSSCSTWALEVGFSYSVA